MEDFIDGIGGEPAIAVGALHELERWRRAAEDAMQQLDWAIGYLHGIRKRPEARMLAANRRVIRRRVLEREAQPLPGDR